MTQLAEITRTDTDGVAVVGITGEVDLSNVTTIEQQITHGLAADAALVVDLTSLEFLDSIGIAMLDRVARTIPSTRLAAPADGHVARVLGMVSLDVPIHDTPAEAAKAALTHS